MYYFIDTNIFLRAFHKENEKSFLECVTFLKAVKENQFEAQTATIVLTEVVWTLNSFYKISKGKIIEGLQSIVNMNGLKIIDTYNHSFALQLFERYSVKYIDALIASISPIIDKEMTVVTYDRDFDKLKVLRQEPSGISLT